MNPAESTYSGKHARDCHCVRSATPEGFWAGALVSDSHQLRLAKQTDPGLLVSIKVFDFSLRELCQNGSRMSTARSLM
jgi:hypothetical protein